MAPRGFFSKSTMVKQTAFQKKGKGGKGNVKGGGKGQFQKEGKGGNKLTYQCELCNKNHGSFEGAEGCEKRCKQQKTKGKSQMQSKPQIQNKPHMQKKPFLQKFQSKAQVQSKPQLQTKQQINVNKPASTSPTTLFECEVCNKKFHGRVAAEACERNCKATRNAKKGAPVNSKISTPGKGAPANLKAPTPNKGTQYSCELCNKSYALFGAAESCERACKAKRGKGGSFNSGKGAGKATVKATINKGKGAGIKFNAPAKTSSLTAGSQGGSGSAAGGINCPKCRKSFSNKFVADGHIRACKK